MLTEAEAKTKWCPMARVTKGDEGQPAFNRYFQNNNDFGMPTGSLCVASCCMLWRTERLLERKDRMHEESLATVPDALGYCGFGPRPEQ